MGLHQRWFWFGRGLLHQFDAHQLGSNGLAQVVEQRCEELEGLRLVFLQRIALGIAAEADDGAQMVEVDDVLAPEMIERLHDDRAFDIMHDARRRNARPFP